MPVTSQHPQYEQSVNRWTLTKAIVDADAQAFIRNIENTGTTDAKVRNKQYKEDAVLTNFTGRTKQGLVGAIYRKEPEVELPSDMEYLIEDATGANIPLDQLSKAVTCEVLETGRAGLLVDFPSNDGDITKADEEFQGLAARMQLYSSWSIINWQTESVQGNSILTMVVLQEKTQVLEEDGFSWTEINLFRVLRLLEGVYVQLLYTEDNQVISFTQPLKADGSVWDRIPFVFIGAENNDSNVDNAPLYDLSVLNLSHYRNSADYEESVHVVGQPTLVFGTEMDANEWAVANPKGVQLGARTGLNVGTTGHAALLQASPNTMAYEAMRLKEEQAIMIGAKLIVPNAGVRTAEETRMVMSSEHSVLNTVVDNVGDGMEDGLEFIAEFMGSDNTEITYELNKEFFKDELSPQAIEAQLKLWQNGVIGISDVRNSIRKSGLVAADRTDDDLENEAQTKPQDPLTDVD